ncbi:hypothetical protein HMPREF9607_01240 [Cutibacterium modestum HL044PA1]|uniref:Uncharacterized protein n=1 Tax=Cutibacterium modestum HL044PA1 TaxID=765109 RepID=A0ABN0C672_9ACTN|nr:hypothetical protein HMPREF9607_01240 [Cutibacterium modestum HL044PA1]
MTFACCLHSCASEVWVVLGDEGLPDPVDIFQLSALSFQSIQV